MFDTLSKGFKNIKNKLQGLEELNERVIDEVLKDVKRSLLEADVAYDVANKFLKNVKEKAMGETVRVKVKHKDKKIKIKPEDMFIKICEDELVNLLGPVDASLKINEYEPTKIMLVGLQGSGKTTTAGKMAKLLMKNGKSVLLVAADVYRPAAIEQLKVIGSQLGVDVVAKEGENPVKICKDAIEVAKEKNIDVVIFDTAGRLAIDEVLMKELEEIKKETNPENIFLVCDAMIGQDAVNMSMAFDKRLDVDGFIMTKLDGDTRGGAILSVKEVTGKPIKFVGIGESLDKFEEFRPEGYASTILGFGDIVGLVKDFQEVVDEKEAEEELNRILKGGFTMDDYLKQIKQLRKMGSLDEIIEKMPGFSDSLPENFTFDEYELVKIEAMINSMTPLERAKPQIINQSRAARIAKGSGRKINEVRNLVAQFMSMKKMMDQFAAASGFFGKIPGLKQLSQLKQMQKLLEGGDTSSFSDLLSGLRGFRKKFDPTASFREMSKEERKKLKNKRKEQKKARKKQKSKNKKKKKK